MATYRVGSSGAGVRELQELLNQNGANIAVDGEYGGETEGAVRQYQQNNGLTVDGIAGDETFGSLRGGTGGTTAKTTAQMLKDYEQPYAGTYSQQIQTLLNKLQNRESFTYDAMSDSLYSMYAEQYQRNGERAMEDTVGQLATLSGGFGNTYAQTAGQQMYNNYMQELSNKVPELTAMAWDRYRQEGEDISQQLALYQGLDAEEYARQNDMRNYLYNKLMDEQSQRNWEREYSLSASRSSGGGDDESVGLDYTKADVAIANSLVYQIKKKGIKSKAMAESEAARLLRTSYRGYSDSGVVIQLTLEELGLA